MADPLPLPPRPCVRSPKQTLPPINLHRCPTAAVNVMSGMQKSLSASALDLNKIKSSAIEQCSAF